MTDIGRSASEPQAVRKGFEWLLSFFDRGDWIQRRSRLETQLLAVARPHTTPIGSEDFRSASIMDDRIGWYRYLEETVLNRPLSYEAIPGARVLPIVEQLGSHVELLDRIRVLREKCLDIIHPERRNPDPGLLEILTALMYVRSGWPQVEFIPRSREEKQPDRPPGKQTLPSAGTSQMRPIPTSGEWQP
jgi:hypothetical protein